MAFGFSVNITARENLLTNRSPSSARSLKPVFLSLFLSYFFLSLSFGTSGEINFLLSSLLADNERMASAMLISEGAMRLNRALLLRKLKLQYDLPITGDIKEARPLNIGASNTIKVHQVNAPFVNFGSTFERCSGSVLVRVDRTTVAIPCFRGDIEKGGSVCSHCEELWNSGPDADGFFTLDKKSERG